MTGTTIAAATAAPQLPAPARRHGRWTAVWGVGLLGLTITSAATMRQLFSVVQEAAKADLRLDDMRLGLVQGMAAAIPIAALSIPIGYLVDRTHRVRLLLAMGALWTAGTFMTAVVNSFALLFLARMLAGLGAFCAVPVAISLASDLCRPEHRGRALLFLSAGVTCGGAFAFLLGGALFGSLTHAPAGAGLGSLSPWRETHLLLGLGSLALLVPLLFMPEPQRHEIGEPSEAGIRVALRELWDRRAFLTPLFFGQVGVVMADAAAAIWATPVLVRVFHQQPQQFAGWLGGLILLVGILGAVIGGFAADLGQKLRRPGGLLIGAVVASALAIPTAAFPVMPSIAGFGVVIALLLLFGAIAGLVTATAIAVLMPNELRGVCSGAFVVVGAVIGLGVAPSLVTWISQALGGESHLAPALAITGLGVNILSFAGFVQAYRKAPASPQVAAA